MELKKAVRGPRVQVLVEMPMPAPAPAPVKEKKPEYSVEDKVREALECIDSGHDSGVEWSMINGIYRKLKSLKKPSERARNLIEMIEATLSKYGYHGVSSQTR